MSQSLPRITARVDEDTRQLLSQAADLLELPSINAFVLSAAVEKTAKLSNRSNACSCVRPMPRH
jgi:uncharacterized protein (DUF1778 family)